MTPDPDGRRSYARTVMGLPVSIHLRGEYDRGRELRALRRCWADLRLADRLFSTYRVDSQIERLNRGELALSDADPLVREVLSLADRAAAMTAGTFDVRYSGRLDPSGIVKGWAAARAAEHLRALRADFYLNAGGDMVVHSDGSPWRVGVEHPAAPTGLIAVLSLRNGAVATSGRAHRGAHIVNPLTGRPASGLAQVTVVGPDLVWADVYATALVAGGSEHPSWQWPDGYAFLAVTDDGDVMTTAGWPGE